MQQTILGCKQTRNRNVCWEKQQRETDDDLLTS